MERATKIVATLGPASSSPEVLEQMIRAGVDVMRLNFSHGTAQDHIDRANLVREVARRAGKEIAIMADLQGPKIRVGKFDGGRTMLENGQKFILDGATADLGTNERVGLDYKELPRDVKPGDTLLLNDGLLKLTVDAVRGDEVHTTVVVGGVLSNNKGINKAGGGLTAPALTAKDMEDIKTAMAFQAEYLAVSFPKSSTDMEMARQLANVAGEPWRHKPALIAKIERSEAIPVLDQILRASDGIMVARRRPGSGGRQRFGAGAAKTHDPHGARDGQGGHHRDADDGVDDRQPSAHARRGQRCGQRGAGRHRCGDAQRRNRGRQVPGRDDHADGRHCARSRGRRRCDARSRLHQQEVRPHRPVDRDGARCSRRTTWAARRSWHSPSRARPRCG